MRVWVPLLPPSSNKIYIRHPQGKGKILSGQARAFKIKAMKAVQDGGSLVSLTLRQNVPYELRLAIFFEAVENVKSTVGARYKKIDSSNRVKLIEDTVAEAVGLDDSHNFRLVIEKHCDPDHPGIYVQLVEVPESEVGLTKEQYDRRSALQLQRPEPDRDGRDSLARRFLGRHPSRHEP